MLRIDRWKGSKPDLLRAPGGAALIAARARGELQGRLANDPQYCDLHHLSSWNVERQTSSFMIGLAEQAAALGRWGFYTFHGIHEGHLPVSDIDFCELLDYLVTPKERIWVAPLVEVAHYIHRSRRSVPPAHRFFLPGRFSRPRPVG